MIGAEVLLGRTSRKTNPDLSYLADRRVMVTGAGGSIGAELCRQIHGAGPAAPAELIMVDRDESALHAAQLAMTGSAMLNTPNIILADIRDRPRIARIMEDWHPNVVIHAAALKHQPLLERYPCEAVKTNVWGTVNVLELAALAGADTFINISTDKAAACQCVLGMTKRIAERLTSWYAPLRYVSVRFGNVLGSRGSVLDTFTAQLRAGRPVTITHPDMTRHIMTVHEAVALALHAGAIGSPGQTLVLDMGEPIRIVDLAKTLARELDVDIDIVYTGLRPGERLHERRLAKGEPDNRPIHPLISHVDVPPLSSDGLVRLGDTSRANLRAVLARMTS
jgi:FlaA1/EpsC-like NDP-sugar epimerase